jgi:hypothetical protein
MFGDGGLYLDRLGKYQLTVSFNKKEKEYLFYVKNFSRNISFLIGFAFLN